MAQIHWDSAVNGNFVIGSLWSTGTVPGPADDAILDAVGLAAPVDYTVTSAVNETVLSIQTNIYATLDITGGTFDATAGADGGVNAGAILIENNTAFEIGGVFDNTGSVSLLAGNNATQLIVSAANASLTGGGLVLLDNDDGNNIVVGAAAGATLTNVDDLIVGAGQIGEGQLVLINDAAGLIEGDGGAGLTINTGAAADTNAGLFEAAGGYLIVQNSTINQSSGGTILGGQDGTVEFQGATVLGGLLNTTGGIIETVSAGNLLNGLASTVTNAGTVEILNNTGLELEGAIANTGTINLLAGNNNTELAALANATLSGGGELFLNDDPNNIVTASALGVSLTNVDNLIIGAGLFGAGDLLFVNDAGATLEAYGANTLVFAVGYQVTTNDGLFEGAGAGGLRLQNSTIDQSGGGEILALSGSSVGLQSADILGGLLVGGGVIETLDGGSQLDGTAGHAVTAIGTVSVINNTALTVIGTIDLTKVINGVTAKGTISLNAGNNVTDLVAGQANATVVGGAVTLDDDPNNEITGFLTIGPLGPTAVSTLTNRSVITGAGRIGTNLRLINDTTIEADGANALIIATGNAAVAGSNTVTNAGLLEAANPFAAAATGGLVLQDGVIANTLNKGVIEATGTTTHVDLQSVAIEGGTLKTLAGGVIRTVDAGSLLDGTAASVANQGTLDIINNTGLTLAGAIDNTGQIDLSAGNNNTFLKIAAGGVSLTGAGQVTLGNDGNNRLYGALATASLTNVDNTISGAGELGDGLLTLVNDKAGIIDASDAVALVLNTGTVSVTNLGLIEATGAGGLEIQSSTVNDANGGTILAATGSVVDLATATIVGGLLRSTGTGAFQTLDTGSLLDGTGSAVTLRGRINVLNNTALTIAGAIDNTGTISLLAGNNATDLLTAGATLTGGGQIRLSDDPNNIIATTPGVQALVNVNNTISGAGHFGSSGLALVNEAAGVIDATGTNALVLATGANTVVNNGLIEATGAGGLLIVSTTISDLTGGVLYADNGVINLQSAYIQGGVLETAGTGAFQTVDAGSLLDGTGSAVTLRGRINVLNNTALTIAGAIDNTGTISLLAGNNATDLLTAGATLTGGGQIRLSDDPNNIIATTPGVQALVNVNNTISGAGHFGSSGLALVNEAAGVIDATGTNALVLATGANTVVNSGLIEATGAGGLLIVSTTISDLTGGVLYADNGVINLQSAYIQGGVLETAGTGAFQTVDGSSLLDGRAQAVHATGLIDVVNNTALSLAGAIVNTGTIAVIAGNNATDLAVQGAVTLSGAGQIILNDDPNNRLIGTTGTASLTNVDNTITGAGLINVGLNNHRKGVIDATGNNALTIANGAATTANAGLMEATGAGGLMISGSTITNTATGTLTAAKGSLIGLRSADIIGGTLKTVGSGVFETFDGGSLLDGSKATVKSQGVIDILNNTALQIVGAIDNLGSVNLQGGNNNTDLIIDNAASLTGGGQITLSGSANNLIIGATGAAVLTNVDNVISGAGRLGGGALSLINATAGIIDATDAAALIVDASGTVINDGVMEATGAGGLTLQSVIDGGAAGEILAATNSLVTLAGATIQGGVLKRTGAGYFATSGSASLLDGTASAVANAAVIDVVNNTALNLAGTIANTGTIALGGGNNNTDLVIDAAVVSLTGAGLVTLTDDPNNAIAGASGTYTLVNVANTIAGAGQLGDGRLIVVNRGAGVIDGNGANQLVINCNITTITNAGLIEATGAGGVVIASTVANTGTLEVNGGNLTAEAAVTGAGAAVIRSGVISFDSTFVGAARFLGASGTLALAQSQTYTGKVSGFSTHGAAGADVIDLEDVAYTGAGDEHYGGVAASGTLTVTDGTHTAHIRFTGNYTRSGFITSSDGHGGTLVTLGERTPIALPDTYTTKVSQGLTVSAAAGVLANDIDTDGLTLTSVLAKGGGPAHGTLTLNANGAFTYTPVRGFSGADSFTYMARDADGQTKPVTVTLVVGSATPVAQPDAYDDGAGQALTETAATGVLANDSDPAGLPLTATLAPGGGPSHGTLKLNTDGSFTYIPTLGFAGTDAFQYIAGDGQGASAPTTVTITVTAAPPATKADAYADAAGHALTETAANGVLTNDVDENGLTLIAALAPGGGPKHGTLTLNANGSFTFTPTDGFAGKDSFTYIASDGLAASAPTTVTITVTATPPAAKADAYADAAGHALSETAANGVLANDTDPNGLALTAALAPGGGPQHGTLTLNANGSFTYTPTGGFAGKDSFTYIASDSLASSAPTTVTLTVTAVAPSAKPESYSDTAGHVLTVNAANGVLANDTDPNGLSLNAGLAPGDGPAHGTLTLNADGSFTYTPSAGFVGTDTFDYIAADALASSAPTVVTIKVTASPPVTRPDTYAAIANQTLTVDAAQGVLANDTDPNGLALTAILAPGGGPEYGTVKLNANGSFTYILNSGFGGFTGVDTFSYIATDGAAQSAPTTVTIDVSNGQVAIAPTKPAVLAQFAAGMGSGSAAPGAAVHEAAAFAAHVMLAAPGRASNGLSRV